MKGYDEQLIEVLCHKEEAGFHFSQTSDVLISSETRADVVIFMTMSALKD